MNKVVSLQERRRSRQFSALQTLLDPEKLFDIPMGEIDQFLDSANDSTSDPVVLQPAAVAALKRLFSRFGIDSLPQTVGELHGALAYCKAIQVSANSIPTDPRNDALWDSIVAQNTASMLPELYEPLLAYKRGDVEKLREIHRTTMTFARMSRHYHPEHGWLSPAP